MLKHEVLVSLIRFYNNEVPAEYEDYCGVCTLSWESIDTVWINGLNGTITLKHWYSFIDFCIENNIKIIKAHRAPRHRLPFSKSINSNYYILIVDDLVQRYNQRKKTNVININTTSKD